MVSQSPILSLPLQVIRKLFLPLFIFFSLITLALAIILRFSNLHLPFWADEIQTVVTAIGQDPDTSQESLAYSWDLHRTTMMSPPAFNLLLHFWLKASRSIIWTRLLPSMIGIFSLVYLFKLGRLLKTNTTATLAVLSLTASSWVFVHYSEEVAIYSASITLAFALCYYFLSYTIKPSTSVFIKLFAVSLLGALTNFSNWIYLLPVGICLSVEAIKTRRTIRLFIFSLLSCLLLSILIFDQMQYKVSWGLNAPYMVKQKLNSVSPSEIPFKIIKDNSDYIAYVLGATPWHLNATFFPSSDRFGKDYVWIYYFGLSVIGLILLFYYLFVSFLCSLDLRQLLLKLLPLSLLFFVLTSVNVLSFFGLYPIGAVRMSLFYSPLVIWSLLQFLDMLLKRINLFSLIIVAVVFLLIINNLTRLVRMPQQHIGQPPIYYVIASN